MVRPRLYGNAVDNDLGRAMLLFARQCRQAKWRKDFDNFQLLTQFALALLGNESAAPGPWSTLLKACSDYINFYLATLTMPVRRESLIAFLVGHLHAALNLQPLHGQLKRSSRAYFTPAPLAYLAWQNLLMVSPVVKPDSPNLPKILDPACGSGSLLIAALDTLERAGLSRAQALSCLRGFDIQADNLPVAALALSVAALCGRDNDRELDKQLAEKMTGLAAQLERRDSLALHDIDADIVVLNPPWQMDKERGSLYKLFLQHHLAALAEGAVKAIAFISPASFLSDLGAAPLRQRLLESNLWRALYVFSNKDRAFDIHVDFRFCLSIFAPSSSPLIKYGSNLGPLADCSPKKEDCLPQFSARDILQIAGKHVILPHLEDAESLKQLICLSQGKNLCADIFAIGREFDMTQDRHLFGRDRADCDWLPLLEGRMIRPFCYRAASYVSGQGRSALWLSGKERQESCHKVIAAQFYVRRSDFVSRKENKTAGGYIYKIGVQSVSGSANKRTVTAAVLDDLPCGNSITVLRARDQKNSLSAALLYCAIFNSQLFNDLIRLYLQGNNLNYFLLESAYLPANEKLHWEDPIVLRLIFVSLAAGLKNGLEDAALARLAEERNLSQEVIRLYLDTLQGVDIWDEINRITSSLYKQDFPYMDFLAKVST